MQSAVDEVLAQNKYKNCSKFVEGDKLKHQIQRECKGKGTCEVSLIGMTDAKFGESKLLLKDAACGDNSMFFIQVPCLIDPAQRDARYLRGLIVGSLCVFIYLFTIIYIDYIKSV